MEAITQFEVGNVYEMQFITDSDLRPKYICTKKTNKSVSFERFQRPSEKITRRVKVWDGAEYIREGNYSMAPTINAKRIVK